MPNHHFHPDLHQIAAFAPRFSVGPRTLRFVRGLNRLRQPRTRSDVELAGFASGAGVRIFRPSMRPVPGPALVWMHGGGYVLGQAQQDDNLCRRFSQTLGIPVVSVDYRLAPEHPYPTALEDCYEALEFAASLADVDPELIAIGGASAGAGLAAALALLARDRGQLTPAFQLLSYPMLDDRTCAVSGIAKHYRIWNERSNRFAWSAYLGDADPDQAVPARRPDLSGLPPAWIGIGTNDLFHDEAVQYAARLNGAGVPCHLDVVQGAFHGFDQVAPQAGVSRDFFQSQCAQLAATLLAAPRVP
jgi:acetyl esterase/lipase